MQRCTHHSIVKIIRIPIFLQYNYHTNGTKKTTMTTQKQQENGLICSEWEEAIIKEQRKPDASFDLMQKDTIDQIHKSNLNDKNYSKQQSNGIEMMNFSN